MHADWRNFDIPEDAQNQSIKVVASVENFKEFFSKNLKLNKVGIISNQMTVIGDLSGHIKNLSKEIGLPASMLKVLEVIAYKVNIALNEVSEYGYSFNSYSETDKKHLLRMKDFSQIFNTITVQTKHGNKTLKDMINMSIYRSLYNDINILNMLSDEDYKRFIDAVYNYAEAGRDILSSLQMQEIDSSKTGIPVDLHKYPFLSNTQDFNIKGKKMKIAYAPTWFLSLRKRSLKSSGAYVSMSIQGKIFSKTSEMETKLNTMIDTFTDENGDIISSKRLISKNYNNEYPNIYNSLQSMVNLYAKERIELNKEKQGELKQLAKFRYNNSEIVDEIINQYKIKEHAIVDRYNKIFTFFMTKNEIPIDKLVIMCYNISVNTADGYYAKSFFLNVLKNEFLIYLMMNSNGLENIKLNRIKLNPEYMYDTFKETEVEVIGNEVFVTKDESYISIGYCDQVPNGKYFINTINDLTYIQHTVKENLIPIIDKKIVVIADNAEKLKEAYEVLCKTQIINGKPVTCLFIDDEQVAGMLHYGFIPELENQICKYEIESHAAKRFTLRLSNETTVEAQIKNGKTYGLIGNIALYTKDDIAKLNDPMLIFYDNAVKENAYTNLHYLNTPFRVYDNNYDALNNSDVLVGRNETILKQLSEKLNKPYILLKKGE